MTICNMSIEGGARVGYVNPDETTFRFLAASRLQPAGAAYDRAGRVVAARRAVGSANASYDDRVVFPTRASIEPSVTWASTRTVRSA
jgi:3-isopropylmalate/(R)-2-methylmalate dehydratase large subunit